MTDQSHITVILDRTGSMDSIRDDVIGGFNAFLAEQQSASCGRCHPLMAVPAEPDRRADVYKSAFDP